MRHGFLLIDKPEGPTSHDVVAQVRAILGERSIGHLGTLDPAASGLLVLAVGAKALKVIELFSDLDKEYDAQVRFGAVSTTYDREGVIEQVPPNAGWSPPGIHFLQRTIEERFLGVIEQVPPATSAIKVGGERAYRKMRQGRVVDLPSRSVEITDCAVRSYAYPNLELHITCGSGTYIRSLAHDLGHVLRCGAYLSALRRIRVGEWLLTESVSPDVAAWSKVIPLKECLESFPRLELSETEAGDIRHGRAIDREIQSDTIAWHDAFPMAIVIPMPDGTQRCRARKVL